MWCAAPGAAFGELQDPHQHVDGAAACAGAAPRRGLRDRPSPAGMITVLTPGGAGAASDAAGAQLLVACDGRGYDVAQADADVEAGRHDPDRRKPRRRSVTPAGSMGLRPRHHGLGQLPDLSSRPPVPQRWLRSLKRNPSRVFVRYRGRAHAGSWCEGRSGA